MRWPYKIIRRDNNYVLKGAHSCTPWFSIEIRKPIPLPKEISSSLKIIIIKLYQHYNCGEMESILQTFACSENAVSNLWVKNVYFHNMKWLWIKDNLYSKDTSPTVHWVTSPLLVPSTYITCLWYEEREYDREVLTRLLVALSRNAQRLLLYCNKRQWATGVLLTPQILDTAFSLSASLCNIDSIYLHQL